MNKLLLFIIVYLVIGYILAKQQKCKSIPVVMPNTPACKITFMDVVNAPVSLIADTITGLFAPAPPSGAAQPISPTIVTDATGTYSSFGGKCYRKTTSSPDAVVVDNSQCTSRGIQII